MGSFLTHNTWPFLYKKNSIGLCLWKNILG